MKNSGDVKKGSNERVVDRRKKQIKDDDGCLGWFLPGGQGTF